LLVWIQKGKGEKEESCDPRILGGKEKLYPLALSSILCKMREENNL